MTATTNTTTFLPLFLNDVPLIDVRAPVEFARGSFPMAVNLPLINDQERHKIGIVYKEQGQDAAVRLGHQLVSGDIKAERIEGWRNFVKAHPEGYLFCFRGGMRSHITQQWVAEAGAPYPLVKGGYKALRRFLIDSFDNLVETRKFFIISGRTGIGKTLAVRQLENAVDLEALANHRGSSFGRKIGGQPVQINFENALAVKLLKICHTSDKPVFVEDESHLIGRCSLPLSLMSGLKSWPMIVVEDTLENRVSNVQKDYVSDMLLEYNIAYGAAGFLHFSDFLKGSLFRIRKRLGGDRYTAYLAQMERALLVHEQTGDESLHRVWISELLTTYYDPMYDFQLGQKKDRIAFSGTRAEVIDWCKRA